MTLWNIVTAENSAHCAWKCDPLKHWNSTDMSQQLIANKSKDFFSEKERRIHQAKGTTD